MYSMVLMAALTTGGTTPDWCHHCRSCYGCYGGCWGACAGCYGCYGYGCAGYWGACYGSGYSAGCYGACWGGYGCSGYGCSGYGGVCGGGYGVGYGGGALPYAPSYFPGSTIQPGAQPPPAGEQLPPPKGDKDKNTSSSTQARLVVELPEDARLYIDDQPMKTRSARRTFHTPQLDRDQLYYYVLKAEVVVDGKPVSETRRVILRAGEVVRANFRDLGQAEAAAAKARKEQAVAAKTR